MKRFPLALFLLLFLSFQAALAQPEIVVDEDGDYPPPSQKISKGKKGNQPGKEAKANPRLQKLQQLSYDRRPSTILKTWAKVAGSMDLPSDPIDFPIDFALAALQYHVTLGNWVAVQKCFTGFKEDEAKAGYQQLLQSLGTIPRNEELMRGPGGQQLMQFMEKNQVSTDDLIELARAAPKGLDKETIGLLGVILRNSMGTGNVVEHVVTRLQTETAKPWSAALTKSQAARLLIAADQAAEAGPFLPTLGQAIKDSDHEVLNMITRHSLAMHAREKKANWLENAWSATQAVLATKTTPRSDQEEALRLAVELVPKLKDELGKTWLDQSFTKDVARGMDILATIGSIGSQGLVANRGEPHIRLKVLQLQKTAVDALLRAAAPKAAEWRHTLTLLAVAWLKEAEFTQRFDTSSSYGPRVRRDRWGNMYYMGDEDDDRMQPMMRGNREFPTPIVVREILETRPSAAWVQLIDAGARPRLTMINAELLLKVGEEAKAFPYIKELAGSHPDKTKALVNQFLTVWTKNHNPNAGREYTDRYMFMYGFDMRSEGIPLTRSKQERNLTDLAGWVEKLRGLKIGTLNEDLLTKAFTKCHSSAEVYRMEAIEKVFGPLSALKPRTLAGLAQQMRENLAGLWREVAVQNDKKTNRKPKDIQVEVLRGYELARTVIDRGLKQFPEEWSLYQAKAALIHDENNYRQELAKSSTFAGKRLEAAGRCFRWPPPSTPPGPRISRKTRKRRSCSSNGCTPAWAPAI